MLKYLAGSGSDLETSWISELVCTVKSNYSKYFIN